MAVDYQRILMDTKEEDVYELARNNFNVSAKMMIECVEMLKDWKLSQQHLCDIDIEERLLKRFLILTEFSVEKAKVKIENYYSARSLFNEYFTNRCPLDSKLAQTMDVLGLCIVPRKTPEHYRVILSSVANPNVDVFDQFSVIKLTTLMGDMRMMYEVHMGDILIYDAENMSLGHCVKILSVVKTFFHIIQNCYGTRIKSIHVINCPNYAYNLMTIVKSILKDKVAKRFYVHPNLESLHKAVSPEYLPANLEGKQKSCKEIMELWKEAMSSPEWLAWFEKSETQKLDETKRVKYDTNKGPGGEVHGSFRKLDID